MPAEPVTSHHDLTDEATADNALVALRRTGLVRSWRTIGAAYEVVVGRGSIRVPALDAAGVVRLADLLRRDQVRVVGRGYRIGHRITRYDLSDGRFADRHDGRLGRYLDDCRYTVYLPGADPSGCAAAHFAAWTLNEAVALAGLVRVRGRCRTCQSARPLDVRGWRADPAIPCPGCGTDGSTPVTVLCHRCHEPIRHNPNPGHGLFRQAWSHVAAGSPHCDSGPTGTVTPLS